MTVLNGQIIVTFKNGWYRERLHSVFGRGSAEEGLPPGVSGVLQKRFDGAHSVYYKHDLYIGLVASEEEFRCWS